MTATRYRIVTSDPKAQLFEVSCTVTDPDRDGQAFRLPAWSPGSYLIRQFARNLVAVRAECVGIEHHLRPAANATDMGGKPASNPAPQVWLGASFTPGPDLRLRHVFPGGPAASAGLAAGDTISAAGGFRASAEALERLSKAAGVGELIEIHAFRRDELMRFSVELAAPASDTCWLA